MEINYEQLIKKILDFWKKYDEKEFTSLELREIFNYYEIGFILCESLENNNTDYAVVIDSFKNKICNLEGILTHQEADELFFKSQDSNFVRHLSNDVFFKYICDIDTSYISDEMYNDVVDKIRTDLSEELKIKAFNTVEDELLKKELVCNFNSDELKLQYLRKFSPEIRSYIIASLKNEKLIDNCLTFFTRNKGEIISEISKDELKIKYFKKFFRILSNNDKVKIIKSLKDEQQLLYYLNFCNDRVKADIASFKNLSKEIKEKIILMIKSEKELVRILDRYTCPDELVIKYIDRVTNINDIFEIISRISSSEKGDQYKNNLLNRYLNKFNEKQKFKIVSRMRNGTFKFKSFKYINNKELLFQLIEHCEQFPEYSDEFEYIIDLYSNKYKVNKDNLLFVVKNISLSVLKVIENQNIIKILNAPQEEFTKIMQLFNKNQLKINFSSMNDILNSFLQREFRIKNSDTIFLFSSVLNAIENKNKNLLLEKMNIILEKMNINDELTMNNWSLDQFIELLLLKDEKAINSLHMIISKFIMKERNLYVQNNLQSALEKSTVVRCDKNDLMKYMISTYPVEFIILFFQKEINNKDYEFEQYYSSEEIDFLSNKELIKKIISYKKNPNNYTQIPDDVKINMKNFSNIFQKISLKYSANYFACGNIGRKTYEFKDIDSEFLISILMNLDLDKMNISLFNNQELLNKLVKIWNQYKIGGWGNMFDPILTSVGVDIDPEIIANFIQYFGLSYKELEEKIKKGELKNISLTALLDLAACYSSESNKYSILFGREDFKYIASNPGPNASSMKKEERMKIAVEFLKIIRDRDYVTVPPVDKTFALKNGKNINIVVGNFSNMMNLTYGERTGACMRIGGAGETLFDFCLKDDNGFHIRFCDPSTGKFISRVSGFRNGNTIFLNQLRDSEDSNYNNKDVVEACKLISKELIEISRNSKLPIENVVITTDFAMQASGMPPKNLGITDPQLGIKKFYTDVSSSAIVLATANQNNELSPFKLGVKDVPKYFVQRDKKRTLYNKECQEYVAHLKTLDQVLSGCSIDDVDVEINKKIVVCLAGEDWCVTMDRDGNLDKYIMSNTNNKQQAIDEVQEALMYLKENLDKEITKSTSLGM